MKTPKQFETEMEHDGVGGAWSIGIANPHFVT